MRSRKLFVIGTTLALAACSSGGGGSGGSALPPTGASSGGGSGSGGSTLPPTGASSGAAAGFSGVSSGALRYKESGSELRAFEGRDHQVTIREGKSESATQSAQAPLLLRGADGSYRVRVPVYQVEGSGPSSHFTVAEVTQDFPSSSRQTCSGQACTLDRFVVSGAELRIGDARDLVAGASQSYFEWGYWQGCNGSDCAAPGATGTEGNAGGIAYVINGARTLNRAREGTGWAHYTGGMQGTLLGQAAVAGGRIEGAPMAEVQGAVEIRVNFGPYSSGRHPTIIGTISDIATVGAAAPRTLPDLELRGGFSDAERGLYGVVDATGGVVDGPGRFLGDLFGPDAQQLGATFWVPLEHDQPSGEALIGVIGASRGGSN